MKNNLVDQIKNMVINISEMNFNISNYDYYQELRDLTWLAWDEFHAEILCALNLIYPEFNIDYQLLWYDSLAFPPEIPKKYYKSGKPQHVFYGFIPSKIYECVENIGGFHDLNVNFATFENNNLSLYLDSRQWRVVSSDSYEVKISFNECTRIFCYDTRGNIDTVKFDVDIIKGKHIHCFDELPMIQYIFDNIELNNEYLSINDRLFHMYIEDYELFVICKGWSS